MDLIKIENLEVFAHHGVYPEETAKGQYFYVNATLGTDTQRAGLTDDLFFSTHYGEVCMFIHAFLTEHTYQLLETCCERLARAILLKYALIQEVTLEIRKPEAPINLPFQSVSVQITRGWKDVYLSVGSNLGDTRSYVEGAVEALKNKPEIRVMRVSDWIVTKPYGGVEQPDFLNGAIFIRTVLSPEELLDFLHEIEAAAGRERKIHWGPRTLDLDILLYEDLIMEEEQLTIPHKDMQNRDFVLKPMKQIAPQVKHPVYGLSMEKMWKKYEKKL